MKILMGITVFLPSRIYGGPATVAFNQARELVKRGHEVTIVTSNVLSLRPQSFLNKTGTNLDGVTVEYFRSRILWPRVPFIIAKPIKAWLRRNLSRFDVVHVHFARDWIPVTIAQEALKAGTSVYLQPHGMLSRRDGPRKILDFFLTTNLLTDVSGVLVLQEQEQNLINAIAPAARTVILPNGVQFDAKRRPWNERSLDRRTALFLARLHPRKRVLDFVDAARLLRERGFDIGFRIVGPDGGDLAAARQRVAACQLNDKVEFVGAVTLDQALKEYAEASIYVLPSVDEPFPMTVLESLSVGTPTIITAGTRIRPLLEAAGAALVIDDGPEAIANGIRRVIEDPGLAKRLSSNGRLLIERELNLEKIVQRLEGVYESRG